MRLMACCIRAKEKNGFKVDLADFSQGCTQTFWRGSVNRDPLPRNTNGAKLLDRKSSIGRRQQADSMAYAMLLSLVRVLIA